jgi:hypothetical protein
MKKILLFILCCGLSGCATMYTVSVDSITSHEPIPGKSCIVVPAEKNVSPDDLQFKEYIGYVRRALALKGYTLSDDAQKADISVSLDYGVMGPLQHNYTYSTPVFGQTGATATTVGDTYSSTTTVTPTYGVVGTQENTGTFVTYLMQIWLNAYETKQNKLLWKAEITSTVNNEDLRLVFPIMIAAASKYLGESTAQKLDVSLYEDSKEVQQIKGIGPTQSTAQVDSNKGADIGRAVSKSNKGNM